MAMVIFYEGILWAQKEGLIPFMSKSFRAIAFFCFFKMFKSLLFCSTAKSKAMMIGSFNPSTRKAYSKCLGNYFNSISGGSSIGNLILPYFPRSISLNPLFSSADEFPLFELSPMAWPQNFDEFESLPWHDLFLHNY